MAILDKLAGLGGAMKDKFDRTFGDGDHDGADADDASDDVVAAPALDADAAWGVLGLTAQATLDDVRAAARTLARRHHPGLVAKDPTAVAALAQVAAASNLLEELLLPLLPQSVAGPGATTTTGASTTTTTRARATARTPR